MTVLIDRFWEKVKTDGATDCWEWSAFKDAQSYGKISVKGKARLAHRVSYELHRGRIPVGKLVCHSCDNPSCVNPSHLFLGVSADNVSDMDRKGRRTTVASLGEDHGRAKLGPSDIAAIRASEGVSQRALAERYGVGQSQIQRIRAGESWSHI